METYRFSIVIKHDEYGYKATCPELEDCCVRAETCEEAMELLKELILLCIMQQIDLGEQPLQAEALWPEEFKIQYSLN